MKRLQSILLLSVLVVSNSACRHADMTSTTGSQGKPMRDAPRLEEPIELAITVDDLPAHDEPPPGLSRLELAARVMDALKANSVRGVYGFSNGWPMKEQPKLIGLLQAWGVAGNYLGNHTYSHMDLTKSTAEAFIGDIEKMERVLDSAPLAATARKLFRYPYLAEGDTAEKRNKVREYLNTHGYQIAQVTVDYSDWAWSQAYLRCYARDDQNAIGWLRENVVRAARQQLQHSRNLAKSVVGRDIKQILLLHLSTFNTVSLADVLPAFRSEGVRFIDLPTALTDPVYNVNPNVLTSDGMTFLEQLATVRQIEDPYEEGIYSVSELGKYCSS